MTLSQTFGVFGIKLLKYKICYIYKMEQLPYNQYYDELDAEARKLVIKQKYQLYHRLRLDNGENVTAHEKNLMDKIKLLKDKNNMLTSNKYYWFITIRPNVDVDQQIFLQRINKWLLNSNKITDYAYVCEITDMIADKPIGFHCHLIIRNNKYEQNKIIRDVKQTMNRSGKNFIEIITKDTMIDVDGRRADHLENTIKYMEGRKKDSKKTQGVNHTIEWRKKSGLKLYAHKGINLDLLDAPLALA